MKNLKLILPLLLISQLSFGQLWQPLNFKTDGFIDAIYADSLDSNLYVGGSFRKVNGFYSEQIVMYDGKDWQRIKNPYKSDGVRTITRFKGDIYVGGVLGIRKLQYDSITQLSQGGTNGSVFNLYNFRDSLLYVAGYFTKVGNNLSAPGIATWDGINWDTLSVNVPKLGSTNMIHSVQFFKNEFYFGGNFTGQYGDDIVRFDGKEWKDVGGGLQGDCWVNDMVVYKNELYITGDFKSWSGNADNHIMRWDGSKWKSVGGGLNHQAWDLMVFQDKLFAVGVFDLAGGVRANAIAVWDGKEWCGYANSFENAVNPIAVYNEKIIVGNGFFGGSPNAQLHYLADIKYTSDCGAVGEQDSEIEPSILVYPNPFENLIKLQLPNREPVYFALRDLNGRVVRASSANENITWDVSNLPSGMYVLEITTNEKKIVKKIIKK